MKKNDVTTSNGFMSRWKAVFECVDSFLLKQLQHQNDQIATSVCLISLLIFNMNYQILLNRVPLQDGNHIRESLDRIKKKYVPRGGTSFSAGFKGVQELTRENSNDKVICVFLSDGRPGDLQPDPEKYAGAVPEFVKISGVMWPSPGNMLEKMRISHSNFNLQLICLCNEGVKVSNHCLCSLGCSPYFLHLSG